MGFGSSDVNHWKMFKTCTPNFVALGVFSVFFFQFRPLRDMDGMVIDINTHTVT